MVTIVREKEQTMKITVVGGSKRKRELAPAALEFFAEKLMSKRLARVLDIEVHFKRNMAKRNGGHTGMLDWLDRNDRPREFIIIVDAGLDILETVETLAHEMVHVKQGATGEMTRLEHVDPHMVRWQGERTLFKDVHYYDFPWEIEAYGRQQGLAVRFFEMEDGTDEDDLIGGFRLINGETLFFKGPVIKAMVRNGGWLI